MLPSVVYNPALDDIWLYRQEQVTYGSATQTYWRPYAWNPQSRLYGYRNSLQALRANNRTFSTYLGTTFGGAVLLPYYSNINPNNEANKAIYYNSFPPTWVKMSDQHMHLCAHCFDVNLRERNPNSSWASWYGDSLQVAMGLRWIKSDNQIIEKTASDFTEPYDRENGQNVGAPKFQDSACVDIKTPVDVPSIKLVNPQTILQGTTGFIIDCNGKIFDVTYVASWVCDTAGTTQNGGNYGFPLTGRQGTTEGALWSYTNANGVPNEFLHDSGDLLFVPISAPTSAEAGDGVLAMIHGHRFSAADVQYQEISGDDIGNLMPCIRATTPSSLSQEYEDWKDYWLSRGVTFQFLNAPRNNQAVATETVEQQILSILNTL